MNHTDPFRSIVVKFDKNLFIFGSTKQAIVITLVSFKNTTLLCKYKVKLYRNFMIIHKQT